MNARPASSAITPIPLPLPTTLQALDASSAEEAITRLLQHVSLQWHAEVCLLVAPHRQSGQGRYCWQLPPPPTSRRDARALAGQVAAQSLRSALTVERSDARERGGNARLRAIGLPCRRARRPAAALGLALYRPRMLDAEERAALGHVGAWLAVLLQRERRESTEQEQGTDPVLVVDAINNALNVILMRTDLAALMLEREDHAKVLTVLNQIGSGCLRCAELARGLLTDPRPLRRSELN
ncbi:hypothetical protein J7I44_11115 [Frateuria sp. MAH-13]|uniref:GAF domain-containing protein n=1 Tax=Frateuria flava TaxID=2821489 RepID=A0ABS4DP66_9GAMM|nr:hypothetical protein [Frateuria flava]MBP1474849.1 hypothetical protein [Frateuria flava]